MEGLTPVEPALPSLALPRALVLVLPALALREVEPGGSEEEEGDGVALAKAAVVVVVAATAGLAATLALAGVAPPPPLTAAFTDATRVMTILGFTSTMSSQVRYTVAPSLRATLMTYLRGGIRSRMRCSTRGR